jgi:hypothetical protein
VAQSRGTIADPLLRDCSSLHTSQSWLGECAGCGHPTSGTAGTIFQDTRTLLATWFRAMWWATNQKTGVSASRRGMFRPCIPGASTTIRNTRRTVGACPYFTRPASTAELSPRTFWSFAREFSSF